MDEILLLQDDKRLKAFLIGALDPFFPVRPVQDFSSMETLLDTEEPLACLLDLFESPTHVTLAALRRLRRKHPTVPLVIASDFTGREIDLYHLGRLRVDGVIQLEDRPSRRDVLTMVNKAMAASLATRVVLETATQLPPVAKDAIRWAVEHAEDRPQVSEFSAALGMSSRNLLREMKSLGLITPRDLLLWGRLIRASHLLERPSETVESVAFHLGYATGGALGKALNRHVGCSPTALLEKGGVAWTLKVFKSRGLAIVKKPISGEKPQGV